MAITEFNIIKYLIDIPIHKLIYAINTNLLNRDIIKDYMSRHSIEYTEKLHNDVIRFIEIKLEGNMEIEREWSEQEYENLVKWEKK